MDAKDYAVWLLSMQDRSEKEVREKMIKKGYTEEECDAAVNFCIGYGYIDDRRYAERFVREAAEFKKLGAIRIKSELKRRGIDGEIIENVTESIEAEDQTVKSEMEKRFGNLDLTDKKVKNKVFGYFARRGFKTGDILAALKEEYDGYDE